MKSCLTHFMNRLMKKSNIVFTSLAFTIAIVAAIWVTPAKAQFETVLAKGKHWTCPIGFVDSACREIYNGSLCTLIGTPYLAIPKGEPFCEHAPVLSIPYY